MSKEYELQIIKNLHNVIEGMVIKNYKELCKVFGLKVKTSNAKKSQLKEIERFVKLEKNGTKYIIVEIYRVPLVRVYGYTNTTKLIDTHPEFYKYIMNCYGEDNINSKSKKIVKWKCSLCNNDFKKRICDVCNSKSVRCSECTSSNGEKLVSKIIRSLNLEYKKEVKFDGLVSDKGNSLRFDFGVYVDSKLLCIIEYDGQYHDEIEIIMYHDKIKNKYCKDNNIPLLRIHHSVDNSDIKMIIVKFVYTLHKTDRLKELIDIDDEISKYKNDLESLKIEMLNINDKILELESKIQ